MLYNTKKKGLVETTLHHQIYTYFANFFFLASQAEEVQQLAGTVQAHSIPSQVRPNLIPRPKP